MGRVHRKTARREEWINQPINDMETVQYILEFIEEELLCRGIVSEHSHHHFLHLSSVTHTTLYIIVLLYKRSTSQH